MDLYVPGTYSKLATSQSPWRVLDLMKAEGKSDVDSEIIAQMRREEADLSRKLKAVRDLLAAYSVAPSNEVPPTKSSRSEPATQAREKVAIEGFSDYGRSIVASAMREMLSATQPVKTRQIVEALQAKQIAISGKDPVNALGAMLYRSIDITSHGKAGWTLADPQAAKEVVGKYAYKENEPHSENAGGSDAGNGSAPTFPKPWENPQSFRAG